MEENDFTSGMNTTHSSGLPIPQITLESLGYLNIAAKWTKFLAILGFIGIGLMLIGGLIVSIVSHLAVDSMVQTHFPFPIGYLGFVYVIFAAVYVFPLIYLNNFSNYIAKAVALRETEYLTIALANLKKHVKYIGIMTIAFIVAYFFIMIGVMIFTFRTAMHTM
jgi:hypothetical protein